MFIYKKISTLLWHLIIINVFGKMAVRFFGQLRFLTIFFAGGVIGGSFAIFIFSYLAPIIQKSHLVYYHTCIACIYSLIISVGYFAPQSSIYILFIGQLKTKTLCIIALIFSIFKFLSENPQEIFYSLASLVGGIFGFLYINQLKKGRDLARPFFWLRKRLNAKKEKYEVDNFIVTFDNEKKANKRGK